MDKPLARWIIGPVKPKGFDCLKEAIDSFSNLYPQFDLLVCHNQLTDQQRGNLEKFGVPLYEQSYTNGFCEPKGVAWKLYPVRLRLSAHELIMDNDLVIVKKVTQIDSFLNEDKVLIYEAGARSYGFFDRYVPKMYKINSGIYGMPPNFDMEGRIKGLFNQSGLKEWTNSCNQGRVTWDEQGIVAAALINYNKYIIIYLKDITNCELDLIKGNGYHFVGINRYTKHKPWKEWQESKLKVFL